MIVFDKVSKSFSSSGANICSGYSEILSNGMICGIYGENGAGKSTLMRLAIGSIKPDSGSVTTKGRIVPFLQLGIAFHFNLTGVDNLYINGMLMGISIDTLKVRQNSIFEFAELEGYENIPLKHYSSGMVSRLAFSIAKYIEGDIYVYDEVLAVGDKKFSKKCWELFNVHRKKNRLVIVVSHDLPLLEKLCDNIVFMNKDATTNPHLVAYNCNSPNN